MVQFVIHDLRTGVILRTGTCAAGDLADQTAGDPGLGVLDVSPTLAANELRDLEATHRVVGGALVAVNPDNDAATRLEELRIATLLRIDVAAGEVRQRYLSSIPGQDGIYARKAHEASLVLADPAIPPDRVPYVAVEADLHGVSLGPAAAAIAAAARRWTDASVAIEARRLAAKRAVRAARTTDEIVTAGTIDWSDLVPKA